MVLSWDKLTKLGQIDLKLERTYRNWDELVWDKFDLEQIDLYLVNSFQLKFVPTSSYHFLSQFVPTYDNSYHFFFQTFISIFFDYTYTQRHKLRTAYSTNDCRGK